MVIGKSIGLVEGKATRVAFGEALRDLGTAHPEIVVVDADRSPASQDLISRFTGSGIFELVDVVSDAGAVDRYLETGDAWMALTIPARYGENLAAGRSSTLQVVADGSDASSTNIAMGYATNLIAGYTQELVEQRGRALGVPAGAGGGSSRACASGSIPRSRAVFHAARNFRDALRFVTSTLSSMAIVRQREIGTLEQLNVRRRPLELILGKLLPTESSIDRRDHRARVIVFWFEVPLRAASGCSSR